MATSSDTDRNLHSFHGSPFDNQTVDLGTVDATGYDDAIKLSGGVRRLTVRAAHVIGGSEDVVDLNVTHDCRIEIARADPRGGFAATIKGASRGAYIRMTLVRHAREVDIDLGNFSEQASGRTGGTTLDVRMEDGSPVVVRVLRADRPTFAPGSGPYRYAFPSPDLGPLHRFFVSIFERGARKARRL